MPKLTEAARGERRAAIVQAARRCFLRKGFHATTISDVCAEAGVSAGAVYTYFQSKHEIVDALSDQASGAAAQQLQPALADPDVSLLDVVRDLSASLEGTAGGENAQLDLHLWSAAIGDDALRAGVHTAVAALGEGFTTLATRDLDAGRLRSDVAAAPLAALLELAGLGMEVKRALSLHVDTSALMELLTQLTTLPASSSSTVGAAADQENK